jgi:uncharacterized iron-regulated membrane protein
VRKIFTRNLLLALIVLTSAWACSVSTAKLSDIKTGKDKEVTQPASTFKAGDTIYANAAVTHNPAKVTVRMYITVDDAPGMTQGSTIPNSEVSMDVDHDGTVRYNFPTSVTTKGGKFMIVAAMIDENGQKKDTKSASVTVEPESSSEPTAATSTD